MKKFLALALFLSLLLNAALLLRKPPETPPAVVRTRIVEKPVLPEAAPTPSPPPREIIVSVPAPAPAAPAARPMVTLLASPSDVAPDGPITVTLSVLSGSTSPRHWIGLYPAGAENSRYGSYLMVHAGAQYVFKAPRQHGDYEFRYVLEDDQNSIATSNRIQVFGNPPPRPAVDLQPGVTTVKAGAEIPASWTVFSGGRSTRDWIGLYAPDAKNEDYVAWKYVSDADQGRLTLQAPDKPGTYEIRYLLDNGYESVATSMRIVVVP